MQKRDFRPVLTVVLLALAALSTPAYSAVIYTYDFPGGPGSGLAANQTNGQPFLGTFSDFTRTGGLTQMPGAPANNTFGTESWNLTASIDTSQYRRFFNHSGRRLSSQPDQPQFRSPVEAERPSQF